MADRDIMMAHGERIAKLEQIVGTLPAMQNDIQQINNTLKNGLCNRISALEDVIKKSMERKKDINGNFEERRSAPEKTMFRRAMPTVIAFIIIAIISLIGKSVYDYTLAKIDKKINRIESIRQ